MNFFGNFGSGPGRPSWSPLGRNTGSFGNGGMIGGGNLGAMGSGGPHISINVSSAKLYEHAIQRGDMGVSGPTSSVMATLEPLFPKVEIGASIMPPCMAAPHVEIPRPLPMRELGERLPFSVPSMEMKLDAIAPAPAAPPVMPAAEKSIAPLPVQEVASTVSTDRTIEAAAPKQSFKERFFNAFSNLGDIVAGEEPIILPDGTKDYSDSFNAESRLQQGAETMKKTIETIADGMKSAGQAAVNFAQEHPVEAVAIATAVVVGTGGGALLVEGAGLALA